MAEALRVGRPRELFSRIAALFQRGEELQPMLRDFVEELGRGLDADHCGVVIRLPADRDQEFISADIVWSAPGLRPLQGVPFPFRGQPLFEQIRTQRETLLFEDCRSDPRLDPFRAVVETFDIGSAVLEPLWVQGRVGGLLALERCGPPRPFSRDEVETLRDVASHARLAIDRLIAGRRERRRAGQFRLLSEVQRQILQLHSLQEILDLITRSLATTLGLRFVCISLLDPDREHLTIRSVFGGHAADSKSHRIRIANQPGGGLIAAAAATHRVILCNDVSLEPRYVARHAEIASELDVPVDGPEGLLGVLSLQSDRKNAFDPEEIDLHVTVAGQVAHAIRSARAFDRESRRIRQLQVLHRVQSSVARLDDPLDLVRSAAETIRQVVPELSVVVSLLDRRRDELVVHARAVAGAEPHTASSIPLADAGSAAAEAARTGSARLIPDRRLAPKDAFFEADTLSALHVPIVSKQDIDGVLTVEAPRPEAFGQEEMATFQSVAAILGVAIDNGRLFERVEREKEDWARTFDAITDMVSIHDQEFRLLRGNRELFARSRVPAYELTGRTCDEVYSGILGIPIECPHPEAERQRRPVAREFARPDGAGFRLTALPRFTSGDLIYSVHICEDTTEETRLREQLLQSEKMSAVGQLVSGVAHELNNPLAGVMGYTQLMLSRPLEPKIRQDLERVFSEAQRAAKIVQNLLTFARKHKPERRYLGVNGIIEKTLELRAYELRVSNIQVETELDPDLPMTMLDFHQMQQVILNIVTNGEQAMLHAHGSGRLKISTRAREGRLEIRFQDDGPGIAPEHLTRVIDPFFTTKPVGQGTGLGLSICDGIVKEHGGSLRVESQPGQGATFIVELPILAAPEIPRPAPGAVLPATGGAGGRSVLVVDDEASIQDLLVQILTRDGFHVDTAASGETALAKVEKRAYDLIISDLKMPGMSGVEMYQRICERRPDLAAKILFTSGDTVSPATDAFLRRAGNTTLPKPFTIDDLRSALERFFPANESEEACFGKPAPERPSAGSGRPGTP